MLMAMSLLSGSAAAADTYEVSYKYATVDGIKIFYREAGDRSKPTLLLLHGFPSSSHEFRDLIPLVAEDFHVIAPDYPGMGYSEAPPASQFTPTFDHVADVVEQLLANLGERRVIVYMTDFGGPVGMRIALRRPEWIAGLVFQNAVISLSGIDPARIARDEKLAGAPSAEKRALAESHVSLETALLLYRHGARNPAALNPDAWTVDAATLANPDSRRIMTDLQLDIPSNLASFPAWQRYLRTEQPPTLVVWGKNDPLFVVAAADAIRNEVPGAVVRYYDTGHFALEEDHADIAARIRQMFAPVHVRGAVDALDGDILTVRTRDGRRQTTTLNADTRYAAVKPFEWSQLKPGAYVGAAGLPADGGVRAFEVMVYREERRGTAQGSHNWDLAPGSSITNATVASVAAGPAGHDLQLTYGEQTVAVTVPATAPIVTYAPAERADLKPGAAVFLVAIPAAHGRTGALSIVVEKNGVKPPL
ncbi:Haloalkane dehalogenase [Paraburkholderia solisilvae]|uniref:Haloalkane dehalogenase n=2 Tax=Paraburkholderia solisilvae TaxID=624376 RepID=A0A6J5ECR2_9BURK|nr:Haloalkane dehalogenase [Paraburkholderia solisilvae]